MTWTRTRAALAIIGASIIAGLVMSGCASVPNGYDDDVTNLGTLVTSLQVTNNNFYDAVVYLNGARVGQVEGNHSQPIPIHDALLRGGRCAQVVVRLIGPGTRAVSTSECIRITEHYQLDIDPSSNIFPLHVWLNPRPNK